MKINYWMREGLHYVLVFLVMAFVFGWAVYGSQYNGFAATGNRTYIDFGGALVVFIIADQIAHKVLKI